MQLSADMNIKLMNGFLPIRAAGNFKTISVWSDISFQNGVSLNGVEVRDVIC